MAQTQQQSMVTARINLARMNMRKCSPPRRNDKSARQRALHVGGAPKDEIGATPRTKSTMLRPAQCVATFPNMSVMRARALKNAHCNLLVGPHHTKVDGPLRRKRRSRTNLLDGNMTYDRHNGCVAAPMNNEPPVSISYVTSRPERNSQSTPHSAVRLVAKEHNAVRLH